MPIKTFFIFESPIKKVKIRTSVNKVLLKRLKEEGFLGKEVEIIGIEAKNKNTISFDEETTCLVVLPDKKLKRIVLNLLVKHDLLEELRSTNYIQ